MIRRLEEYFEWVLAALFIARFIYLGRG